MMELNDPSSICHPQGFLEGLSVAKHPKIFPLELQFNFYGISSGGSPMERTTWYSVSKKKCNGKEHENKCKEPGFTPCGLTV